MAVSRISADDPAVLDVWRQTSSTGLAGLAAKTPVVGNAKVRGVPNCRFFAIGVTEKMLPRELTACIQQDTLPVAPMVAWALATKAPAEAGVIVATTVEAPGSSEVTVLP